MGSFCSSCEAWLEEDICEEDEGAFLGHGFLLRGVTLYSLLAFWPKFIDPMCAHNLMLFLLVAAKLNAS